MPLIILAISIMFGFALCWVMYEACCLKCMKRYGNFSCGLKLHRKLAIIQCTLRFIFGFVFALVALLLLCFYLVLGLAIASVMFAIMVVPSILLYLFVIIKKNFVWNNTKGGKSSSKKKKEVQQPESNLAGSAEIE